MVMKNKITIAIPAYNNEEHIAQAIESALAQEYPMKEILVCDDCSTDKTVEIANSYPGVKVIKNSFNMGIGNNLGMLMSKSQGKYIIYLCADDLFANSKAVSDYVKIFDRMPDIGVIGRYYYYFLDGHQGPIGLCREKNILIQSCCPSGMAFRNKDFRINWTNKIFIEMPNTVAQYITQCRWTMLEYDTIAARFHPGGNTGTKKSYYTESPTQNWIDLLGINFQDFPMFIQLKNRAPHLLWREICLHVKNDKSVLTRWDFWKFAVPAMVIPSSSLRALTEYYRHRITRKRVQIIDRPLGGI